ncbi:alpha-glucosidase [Salicibibacter halophilus]|uniref:Alpha-glucosidase n=1 Tax=Salicibibacter halophilus TaxID=2502791 RepID=A0A514LM11_9BACI|nr:TIM-barrel domain-containing protein [Salicibibacter halophilus]QDI92876.1 alpha-glucosidase [Salicibibacter halophilus]
MKASHENEFNFVREQDNQLQFHSHIHDIYLKVSVLEKEIIRVTLTKQLPVLPVNTWAVAPGDTEVPYEGLDRESIHTNFSLPEYSTTIDENICRIETELLQLEMDLHHFTCKWYRKQENGYTLLAEDRRTQAYFFQIASDAPVSHYLHRGEQEAYYGFGEKTGLVNKHGERFRMSNIDAMGYNAEKTDPLYKHIPFYTTFSRENRMAYGLYYDDYNECLFDMGRELDNYHGAYRYFQTNSDFLDFYFIGGPTVADVTRRFSWLTGRPAKVPKWSIGYSGSTMRYTDEPRSQEKLFKFLNQCKQYDIHCDSFHLSSGYTSIGEKRYVFHWNRYKFPNPKAFTEQFYERGVRILANIKPSLLIDHPAYQEVADRSLLITDKSGVPEVVQFWDEEGVYLDFTNEQTIKWWKDKVKTALLHKGITSTWNDNNEFEVWNPQATVDLFGKGGKFHNYRAVFPLLMTKASLEAQKEYCPDEIPFLISRSGCAGLNRYAQTWTGDNHTSWHTLKFNVKMAIGLSLSGIYNFGHDTGGFSGNAPNSELFLRWIQSSVYYPRFTIHSWNDDGTVNEPWMHSEITHHVVDAMDWHEKLKGYIFSLICHSSEHFEPILKPTFFAFPEDMQAYIENDEFMLGDELLICTIVTPGSREREVYLPSNVGGWYDLHTEFFYGGGKHVSVPAPLSYTPVFVKGGSILPIETEASESLEVRLYPGEKAQPVTFEYYDEAEKSREIFTALHLRMWSTEEAVHVIVEKKNHHTDRRLVLNFYTPQLDNRPVWVNGEKAKEFWL